MKHFKLTLSRIPARNRQGFKARIENNNSIVLDEYILTFPSNSEEMYNSDIVSYNRDKVNIFDVSNERK